MAYPLDTITGLNLICFDEDDAHEYEFAGVTIAEIPLTWGEFREYLRTSNDPVATVETEHGDMEIWDIQLVTQGFDDIYVVAIGAPTTTQMVDRVDPRSVLSEPGVEVLRGPKRPTVLAKQLDALFETAASYTELRGLQGDTMSIDYLGA